MLNDTTIVTFEFRPDQEQKIPADALGALARAMEELAGVVFDNYGQQGVRAARLHIVASPRPGSIQIIFSPEFHIALNIGNFAAYVPGGWEDVANKIVDAGWALFIWQMIFGDRGILDLIKHPEMKSAEVPMQEHTEKTLRILLTPRLLVEPNVQRGVKAVIAAAASSQAHRVTIQIRDEPAVEVWDATERLDVAALTKLRRAPLASIPTAVGRTGKEIVRVRFRGQIYPMFVGKVLPPSLGEVAIVWASKLVDVPTADAFASNTVCQVERVEEIIRTTDIELVDPLPDEFLNVQAIYFVPAAAKFG